ncbi:MAG: DUF1778 domain-containing protein [Candidatus Solibacter sp.]
MPHSAQDDFTKSERFHIRATTRQANLIKAGAARRNANLTEYIVDSTCTQAEMDLADQNHFVLPPKAWDAFAKALDSPPKVPPGLKRLFAYAPVAQSR